MFFTNKLITFQVTGSKGYEHAAVPVSNLKVTEASGAAVPRPGAKLVADREYTLIFDAKIDRALDPAQHLYYLINGSTAKFQIMGRSQVDRTTRVSAKFCGFTDDIPNKPLLQPSRQFVAA